MPEIFPSPRHPAPSLDEPATDPNMPVSAEYLKKKLTQEQRTMTIRGWLMALGSAVVIVAGTVILVLIFIDNRVAAQTDAGVKVHEQRLSTLEQQRREDRSENSNRMDRMEQNQNGDHSLILDANKKLDVVIKALGVPNPAPTPKDAGQ